MHMPINRNSPLPLYLQLAEILKDKIEAREYPPGSKIPSETQLSKTHNLGRPTIRQALGMLVHEGRLEKRKGAGTFVREPPPEIDLFSLAGTASAFGEKGVELTQRLLKKISLVDVENDSANPFANRKAYFFSRLNLHKAEAILLEETYLDPILFRGIDRYDFAKQSLSRIVRERFYVRPDSCRQTFRAVFDRTRALTLGLRRPFPLLFVSRTINFPDFPGGIFSLLFCRTDRFTFAQNLGGAHET